jgi:hypothetical protein
MTTNLIITLSVLGVSLLTWMFIKAFYSSNKEQSISVEVMPDESIVQTEKDLIEKVKEEKVEESTDEMEKRLVSISNPDSEKPFAKISTPEISEIPSTFIDSTEKTSKKRNYKKRTPKK